MKNSAGAKVRAASLLLGLWALLLGSLAPLSASAAEGLGIAVRVLPEVGSEVENNNYLWLSAGTDSFSERTIEITSQSDIPQRIYFEIFDELNVDGQLTIDTENSSDAPNWLTFSPAEAVLQPRETITFKARFEPKGEDLNYFGFLRIYAEAAEQQQIEEVEGETYRAYIGGRAAIRIPVWFGTGTAGNAITDFAITGLRGVIVDGENKIQLTIQNVGDTPIAPNGFVEFADPSFASLKAGPYPFRTNTIRPGQTTGILIDIDESLTEQPWRALVEARQGPIVRTKSFNLQLTFVELGSMNLFALLIQIGLLLVGLALALVGLRLFRGRGKLPPREPRVIKTRPPRPDPMPKEAAALPSVDELMARIRSSEQQSTPAAPASRTEAARKRETVAVLEPSVASPPPIDDPWEFLLAARQARWSEASNQSKTPDSTAKAKSKSAPSKSKRPASQGTKSN